MTPEELAGLLDDAPADLPPDLSQPDRAVLESLRQARAALVAWGAGEARYDDPGAEPMPAEVAARLDAALAAEPVLARNPSASASVTTLPTRGRRRTPAWALPVAAAVVLLAGGVALVTTRGGGGTNDATTTASAPAAGQAARTVAIARSETAYATPEALDEGVRALLGGQLTPAPGEVAASVRAAAAAAPLAAVAAPTLAAPSVAAPLPAGAAPGSAEAGSAAARRSADTAASTAASTAADAAGGTATTTTTAAGAAGLPRDLARCLGLLDPEGMLLGVDQIVLAGVPSTLVVFAGTTPNSVAAYVVGPDCDIPGPTGLRTVRFVQLTG